MIAVLKSVIMPNALLLVEASMNQPVILTLIATGRREFAKMGLHLNLVLEIAKLSVMREEAGFRWSKQEEIVITRLLPPPGLRALARETLVIVAEPLKQKLAVSLSLEG